LSVQGGGAIIGSLVKPSRKNALTEDRSICKDSFPWLDLFERFFRCHDLDS
jgi:hypothetical protein